jgi:hypothetical protein
MVSKKFSDEKGVRLEILSVTNSDFTSDLMSKYESPVGKRLQRMPKLVFLSMPTIGPMQQHIHRKEIHHYHQDIYNRETIQLSTIINHLEHLQKIYLGARLEKPEKHQGAFLKNRPLNPRKTFDKKKGARLEKSSDEKGVRLEKTSLEYVRVFSDLVAYETSARVQMQQGFPMIQAKPVAMASTIKKEKKGSGKKNGKKNKNNDLTAYQLPFTFVHNILPVAMKTEWIKGLKESEKIGVSTTLRYDTGLQASSQRFKGTLNLRQEQPFQDSNGEEDLGHRGIQSYGQSSMYKGKNVAPLEYLNQLGKSDSFRPRSQGSEEKVFSLEDTGIDPQGQAGRSGPSGSWQRNQQSQGQSLENVGLQRPVDLDKLTDSVYRKLERKITSEKERRGW